MRLHEMEEEEKTFVRAGLTRKYRKHSLTTALKKKISITRVEEGFGGGISEGAHSRTITGGLTYLCTRGLNAPLPKSGRVLLPSHQSTWTHARAYGTLVAGEQQALFQQRRIMMTQDRSRFVMHMFIEEVAHASTYITMCAACSKRKWLQHDCNESNYTKRYILYIYILRTGERMERMLALLRLLLALAPVLLWLW